MIKLVTFLRYGVTDQRRIARLPRKYYAAIQVEGQLHFALRHDGQAHGVPAARDDRPLPLGAARPLTREEIASLKKITQ